MKNSLIVSLNSILVAPGSVFMYMLCKWVKLSHTVRSLPLNANGMPISGKVANPVTVPSLLPWN